MEINTRELGRLLEKWQGALRLKDWDIKLQIVDVEWRKTGDIKIEADDRKAVLMLNGYNPKKENLEEVLLHELLHLMLWDMDQMIEELLRATFGSDESDPRYIFAYNKFMLTLESTVQSLTRSLLSLGGEDKEISFGRIQRLVNKELGKSK